MYKDIRGYIQRIVAIVGLILFGAFVWAQTLPDKPSPARFVNDFASVFSLQESQFLEQKLVAYNDATSTQIVVVTVPDLQGMDKASFAVELAEKWGIGQKGKDNGVLILIKPKMPDAKGKVYIAVGYGLEALIPDATAKRIVSQEMIPYFQQDQMFAGVNAAVDTIFKLLTDEFVADNYAEKDSEWGALIILVTAFLFFIVFVYFSVKQEKKHSQLSTGVIVLKVVANVLLNIIIAILFRGGGSSGGSSGGGSRSFGGGSFGGGGAGGSW